MTCHLETHLSATFSEDAPRPPVPGGGGDDEKGHCFSNATSCIKHSGVMSNVCSASLADDLKTASGYSCTGTKCCSYYESTNRLLKEECAGRGCEPDGCVRIATKFAENGEFCMSDPSLKYVLEDSCGVSYFRRFLHSKLSSDALEFWLSCSGFRKVKEEKLRAVAMAIFKKFVARNSDRLGISNTTKLAIKERLKYGRVETSIFDDAFAEVESLLLRDFYPLFLNSMEFAEYIHSKSADVSPRQVITDGQSSPSNYVQAFTESGDSNKNCSNIILRGRQCDSLTSSGTGQLSIIKEHTILPSCSRYALFN